MFMHKNFIKTLKTIALAAICVFTIHSVAAHAAGISSNVDLKSPEAAAMLAKYKQSGGSTYSVSDYDTSAGNATTPDDEVRRFVNDSGKVKPYGANLFMGQFRSNSSDGLNPNYIVMPGDKVNVAIWGAYEFTESLTVDAQGNIFIPSVGPVKVAGVRYSNLTEVVKAQISQIYTDGIEIYTNLQGTKPIAVYVTGAVNKPGRYSGVGSDTPLHYIDNALGIDEAKGSYRNIEIKRDGKTIEIVDLYRFLQDGTVPSTQLKDGDVIFVADRTVGVKTDGEVKRSNIFEFSTDKIVGEDVAKLAEPNAGVTHVAVSGIRNKQPFSKYLTLEDFKTAEILDKDTVSFVSGNQAQNIKVFIEGTHKGPNVIVAPKNATLLEILNQVKIDPASSDYKSVYVERASVAVSQKIALDQSLQRLQENILLSPSVTQDQAGMRSADAVFIEKFIATAKSIKPTGRIVVTSKGDIVDIKLEDGDRVIIPETTNIVSVNGEVTMPKVMVFKQGSNYKDYIKLAGGFSERANEDKIYVIRASGETFEAGSEDIKAGDQIVVLPELKFQGFQLTKDITDIFYKVILAIAVPANLFK